MLIGNQTKKKKKKNEETNNHTTGGSTCNKVVKMKKKINKLYLPVYTAIWIIFFKQNDHTYKEYIYILYYSIKIIIICWIRIMCKWQNRNLYIHIYIYI